MAVVYNYLSSNNYFESLAYRYKEFKKTPQWDEQYKWDTLRELNSTISYNKFNPDNIIENIKLLQKYNPSKGSFVHWKEVDDLLKVAKKDPENVVSFFRDIINKNRSVDNIINHYHRAFRNLQDGSNFGISLFAYILAIYNKERYPIYKDSVFKKFWELVEKKEKIPRNIGEKYGIYVRSCEDIAKFLKDKNIIEVPSALDGQDFMYCITTYDYFNNITKKELRELIHEFINQSKTNNFKYKKYEKMYNDFKIKVSFGQGAKAYITWMTFLKDDNKTSQGIYPGILFDWENDIVITIYGVSETHTPRLQWPSSVTTKYDLVANSQYTTSYLKKIYPNSYVCNLYDLSTQEVDTVIQSLIEDIDFISKDYSADITRPDIYDTFSEFLNEKGYIYDQHIIENFLLSLKVKPFLILTGNSGTGKTKLAQLFGQYYSLHQSSSNHISTEVKIGKAGKNLGWSLRREDIFSSYPHLESFEQNVIVEIEGKTAKAKLNVVPRVFFERDSEFIDHLEEIQKEDPNKRVQLKIYYPDASSSTYSIIPVGANWTENRHIMGYHNVITGSYQTTNSLELILQANSDPHSPYFLILDEMNLSHVERYFSDFLSALESNEPIPLHNAPDKTYSSVTIPSNLFVIGTVNIDETTYMFSPKVLDRANTIEFDVFNADAYLHGKIENNHSFHNVAYLENPLETSNNAAMTIEDIREAMNTIAISESVLFWEVFSRELTKFQATLKPYRLSFGFRVINEIARFMYVAWNYEGRPGQWPQWDRYFDAQIKQKILPKLHGSKRMLGTLLQDLIDLCRYDDTIRYETSYQKLQEMQKILDEQRYVSFTC